VWTMGSRSTDLIRGPDLSVPSLSVADSTFHTAPNQHEEVA